LNVEGLQANYHSGFNPFGGGRVTLTYRLRNSGNVRLGSHQTVTVKTLWGQTVASRKLDDVQEMLPGNAIDISGEFRDVFPAVLLTVEVRLDPVGRPGDTNPPLVAGLGDTTFWAINWTLLALVILVIAAVVLLILRRRRRRRRVGSGAGSVEEVAVA
jgi:hypothetical protein